MLDLSVHKIFTKDLNKAQLNPTNSAKLFLYISLLLNNEELPQEARDHFLSGEWKDTKEFHISGDLLVIYMINNNTLQLLRIGTHSLNYLDKKDDVPFIFYVFILIFSLFFYFYN